MNWITTFDDIPTDTYLLVTLKYEDGITELQDRMIYTNGKWKKYMIGSFIEIEKLYGESTKVIAWSHYPRPYKNGGNE